MGLVFISNAQAQVRHVVFDLDATLIQGIPSSKTDDVKKADVFQVKDGRTYSYVVRPHAKEIIQRLIARDRLIVHIASDLPQARTDLILSSIKIFSATLKETIEQGLGEIHYLNQNKLDLKTVALDPKQVLFISSKNVNKAEPEDQTIFLGQFQYYFDSYKLAQAEEAALAKAGHLAAHAAYLPKDEDSFDQERHKLAKAYLAALQGLEDADFKSGFDARFNSPNSLETALKSAGNKYDTLIYELTDKSCVKTDLLKYTSVLSPLLTCAERLKLPLTWKGESCVYQNINGEGVLTLNPPECVKRLPVDYYWSGIEKENCQAFAQGRPKLRVPTDKCSNKHALWDSKKQIYHVLEAFSGMENMTVEQIIRTRLDHTPKFSLAYYDPAPQRLKGVSFPRNGALLWRGMDPVQYDLTDAVRAMLGDSSANVESKAFTRIKSLLMGKTNVFPGVDIGSYAASEIKKHKFTPYSEKDASLIAEKIIDGYFFTIGSEAVKKSFLDYWSISYVDWNPWGIFSSIAPAICHTYNKSVLLSFRESGAQRSSDLNYYNYVENGSWKGGFGSGHHGDSGEFITPGHIEAQDVQGFFLIDPSTPRIHTALLKFNASGQSFIAGVEDYEGGCLVFEETDMSIRECEYTEDAVLVTDTEAPVAPSTKKVSAQFVLKLCAKDAPCDLNESIARNLGLGEGARPALNWIKRLQGLNLNGMLPRIFLNAGESLP